MSGSSPPRHLRRTKALQGRRVCFFLPLSQKDRNVSGADIAFFIKQAVILAYSTCDSSDRALAQVNAHQLRLLASSLAHASKVSVEDILNACSWKASNTFTSFYLRSLESHSTSLYSLGPLSVAQTVVLPGRKELVRR